MASMSVLAFSLAALLGFASYYLTRDKTSRVLGRSSARPNLVGMVAIGSGLALAAVLMIFVSEIHTELGTHVWHAYRFMSTPIAYCSIVGAVFGYLFGYWSSFLMKPELLSRPETSKAHGRWGLVLLTLLIVTLFAPSVDALLGRITSINSAPLQLSFSPTQRQESENDAGAIVGPGKNGSDETAQQASALGRANFYSGFAIPILENNAISDPYYISILRSETFPKQIPSPPSVLIRTAAFSSCLRDAVKGSFDPLLVHTYFGPAIHRLRSDTLKKSGATEMPAESDLWIRNYVVDSFAKHFSDSSTLVTATIPDQLAEKCIIRLPSRQSDEEIMGIRNPIFEKLYENLLVSFALGAAGAHEASIRTLAEWIHQTEERYKNLLKRDRAFTELSWAQIRAKQYLAISLAMEGMHNARHDLLSEVTLDMEELFVDAQQQGIGAILRDPDLWVDDKGCQTLEDFVSRKPNFESDWDDLDAVEKPFANESNAVARLMMSYVSYTDLYVEEALSEDSVDARVFNYAKRNAHIPSCLFTLGLGNLQRGLEMQARYQLQFAKVLLFASEFWGGKITYTSFSDLQIQKEALRHLIKAEDFLNQTEDGGEPSWYTQIVDGTSGTEAMRRQIDRLIKRLTKVVDQRSEN
ncbi:hypothetical protein AB7M35_002134 [Amorphus suaedae]